MGLFSRYMNELRNLVASVQTWEPETNIVVWDVRPYYFGLIFVYYI